MFRRIVSTVFNAVVVLVAMAAAVWLTITGHTLQIGGLLLAMWGILGAVMFGFRLAEGFGPDHLSIWAGPVWLIRPPASALGKELRKAA
jgi:hypothetical protein